MRLYKLTDKNDRTYGECQWGENITHETSGEGNLCGPGWLHAYEDPYIAVFINSVHACFFKPNLWEAEGRIGKRGGFLKCGCTRLTTLRRLALPDITIEHRIRFAILCAKQVYTDQRWVAWADSWLCNHDRSASAARMEFDMMRTATCAYPAGTPGHIFDAAFAAETAALAAIGTTIGTTYIDYAASAIVRAVDAVRAVGTTKIFPLVELAHLACEGD